MVAMVVFGPPMVVLSNASTMVSIDKVGDGGELSSGGMERWEELIEEEFNGTKGGISIGFNSTLASISGTMDGIGSQLSPIGIVDEEDCEGERTGSTTIVWVDEEDDKLDPLDREPKGVELGEESLGGWSGPKIGRTGMWTAFNGTIA